MDLPLRIWAGVLTWFWRGLRGLFLALILVVPAGIVGTAVALGWTGPGRRFAAGLVPNILSASMNGRLTIDAIEGNLINHIVLRGVTITGADGTTIVAAHRVSASYYLPSLYNGSLLFHDVVVDTATVHLARTPADRWNYQEAFRSGGGSSRSAPPLVQIDGATLNSVSLQVDVPVTHRPTQHPVLRNATPPAQPRIEARANGLVRVYTAEDLHAVFTTMRISTPKDDPLHITVASLRARLTDPALSITSLQGTILQAADSLRFTFDRASLPGTVLTGAGAVRWPHDTVLFDFHLDADTVDLKDLRWVSPDFPDWQGRGRVVAFSTSETRTRYHLDNLTLGNGQASATGQLDALVDVSRGVGFGSLALTLRNVPLAVARPYLDTLPFVGTLNGELTADGFLDTMRLGGNLTFQDALVAGLPTSHFAFEGKMHFGGDQGAIFEAFQLAQSSIPLSTVSRIVPAIILPGTLGLTGRLDGPWLQVNFLGVAEHYSPSQARSRMVGRVMLDTRDTILGIDLDGNFDQLSFEGLRSGYPGILARGGLTGRLALLGKLNALQVDGAMTGEIGTFRVAGNLNAVAPTYATDSLRFDFLRMDSDALVGQGGQTSFSGRAILKGSIDSSGVPKGSLSLSLDRSRFGALVLDAAEGRIRADSGLAVIDTFRVDLSDGWIDVEGNLGLDSTHAGRLLIDAGFTSLAQFDSLVRVTTGLEADTLLPRTLGGTLHANFTVKGSIQHPDVSGTVQAKDLKLDQWQASHVIAVVRADSLGERGLTVSADADSIGRGKHIVERAALELSGPLDSLNYAIQGQMYTLGFAGQGHWVQVDSLSGHGVLDSLALNLPRQKWRLDAPVGMSFSDGSPALLDTLLLQSRDGAGQLTLSGKLPGRNPGELLLNVLGVEVNDLVSMVQRDSSIVNGVASLDLRLGGTAAAPLLRGNTAITGPSFDEVRIPLIRAAFDYRNQRLRSQLTFWKTGEPLLQADVSLPLDLAFSPVGSRQLPGELSIVAHADSADLALLEAFTPSVRDARGRFDLDMTVSGSLQQPRFDGVGRISSGSMTLPDLNTRYNGINAKLRFTGDSIVFDTFKVQSAGGRLDAGGSIRFEELTSPRLALSLTTSDFLLIDVPNYFTLRPSGTVTLRGPLLHPVMTGRVALARSAIYYSDLVTKSLVDLSDPIFADLRDTAAVRRLGLGRTFQNRFLDSLRVDSLRFSVNEDVSLRSSQAYIVLSSDGEARVSKTGRIYRVDGSFTVARGTYTVAGKTFKIDRGTVSYFGTPDLNATLDLQASHTVRTSTSEDIPIQANIGGEILAPDIKLTSPGHNLSQLDLVSYLYFKVPASQISVNSQLASSQLLDAVTSLGSRFLSQALSSNLGVGVELSGLGSFESRAALSRQVGNQAFVTLSGGLCTVTKEPIYGAAAEYRLSNSTRIQASYGPIQSCPKNLASFTVGYQFGGDLLWRREY